MGSRSGVSVLTMVEEGKGQGTVLSFGGVWRKYLWKKDHYKLRERGKEERTL